PTVRGNRYALGHVPSLVHRPGRDERDEVERLELGTHGREDLRDAVPREEVVGVAAFELRREPPRGVVRAPEGALHLVVGHLGIDEVAPAALARRSQPLRRHTETAPIAYRGLQLEQTVSGILDRGVVHLVDGSTGTEPSPGARQLLARIGDEARDGV